MTNKMEREHASKFVPTPLPESYWVIPDRFLAGEYPGWLLPRETLRRLQGFLRQGVNAFLDLTQPDELPPYDELLHREAAEYAVQVRYRRFSIGDAGVPTREEMKAILDYIDESLEAGYKIYVHCRAGVGRTGTVVGCYLIRHDGWSNLRALSRLQTLYQGAAQSRLYPFSPETNDQRQFILTWRPEW